MKTLSALVEVLTCKCRQEMDRAAGKVRGLAIMLVSLCLAATFLLGAVGLGIAAVFIGIANHLGGAVAAVISGGILLVVAMVMAMIGLWRSK